MRGMHPGRVVLYALGAAGREPEPVRTPWREGVGEPRVGARASGRRTSVLHGVLAGPSGRRHSFAVLPGRVERHSVEAASWTLGPAAALSRLVDDACALLSLPVRRRLVVDPDVFPRWMAQLMRQVMPLFGVVSEAEMRHQDTTRHRVRVSRVIVQAFWPEGVAVRRRVSRTVSHHHASAVGLLTVHMELQASISSSR